MRACEVSIPVSSTNNKPKVVPGWNEHVEHYFRTSLFWHKYWVEKGRPEEGIIAEIRRNTRANYHKARKMVIKYQDSIQSNKLAESLFCDSSKVFWNKARKSRGNNQRLPNCVDNKQGPEEIAHLFRNG